MASSSTTTPDIVLYARGIIAILELWPALRLAVEESWGGPESADKRRWLSSELIESFEDSLKDPKQNPTPDPPYVEEMLLQVMGDEFEANLEDGSAERVARDMVKLWDLVIRGEGVAEVERLEKAVDSMKGKKVQYRQDVASDDSTSGSEEEGDWTDSEEEEAPPLLEPRQPKEEPEVDEEGFTLVKKVKGKR